MKNETKELIESMYKIPSYITILPINRYEINLILAYIRELEEKYHQAFQELSEFKLAKAKIFEYIEKYDLTCPYCLMDQGTELHFKDIMEILDLKDIESKKLFKSEVLNEE